MVQLEDDVYRKLMHDANDNQSILSLAKIVCITIVILIITVAIGLPLATVQIDEYKNDLQLDDQIKQAKVNVEIRKIESEGMTSDEYLTWLKIKK